MPREHTAHHNSNKVICRQHFGAELIAEQWGADHDAPGVGR